MLKYKLIPILACLTVMAFFSSPKAHAAMQLRISDGTNTYTIADDGVSDGAAGLGAVSFNGAVGNFTVNVVTNLSKPIVGSTAYPEFDTQVTTISNLLGNTGGGTLTIEITDTDFGPSLDPLPFLMMVESLTSVGGNITFDAYVDTANTAFGQGELIGTIGPFTAGSTIDTSTVGSVATSSSYSVTAVYTIVHSNSQNVSSTFSTNLQALPEPTTMAIWGLLGLTAVGGGAWRRRRAAQKS